MTKNLFPVKTWIQIAIINFCVVALAGITMRYKINFPLPIVNQKHLLYAHSNFAFMGWVTIALMVLMINYLLRQNVMTNYRKYSWILISGCISAYGMFVTFIIQGYGYFSISFSIISILISWFFIFFYWFDLNKVTDKSYAPKWFKAALILMAIASFGEITLAYLMVNFSTVQDYYFGALYFFLHFQYNGWFLFVCFGLLFSYLFGKGFLPTVAINKHLFIIMAITVAPTYLLSILWLKLPRPLHLLANISGILQLLVLFYFIRLFPAVKKNIPRKITKTTRYLWTMAAIAFILKIVLQTFSIIPFFSNYAFGFRPIVIGYLHLSFLGIISFFILGYINQILSERGGKISGAGVIIFTIGVLVQEFTLMAQGLEVLNFEPLPFANTILFYAAIAMGAGLIRIAASVKKERLIELA
ncbi:MAG TPA: hypothetical protein VLI68_06125 [Hanamia sp.]|jgi:hypothetical protein|nr:hypothetical protein [Hanamia sp.]